MKKLFVMLAATLIYSPHLHAEEVYNFYFQKAPGAQKVQQGEVDLDAPEVAPAQPQVNTEKAPAPLAAYEEPVRRSTLSAGYASFSNNAFSGTGIGVGFQHNWNSWFGYTLNFISADQVKFNQPGWCDYQGLCLPPATGGHAFIYTAGFAFTFFHEKMGDQANVSIAALLGADGGRSDIDTPNYTGYIGFSAVAMINRALGLNLQWRVDPILASYSDFLLGAALQF